ncbi:hypothetical protein N8501_02690 [Synechococcus sp. AH-601-N10]|nr:hypothetical protein [Synechococcus sp. AH-601-N10]
MHLPRRQQVQTAGFRGSVATMHHQIILQDQRSKQGIGSLSKAIRQAIVMAPLGRNAY